MNGLKHTYYRLYLLKCISFVCFFIHFNAQAQDIHFSQYNGSVLNLNPAFTGFFDGDYRMNAIYRTQWMSVPVSYNTLSLAGDARLKFNKTSSDRIGLGLVFNNDKAGDANYGINQLYLSGSYIHKLTKDSTLLLSTGIAAGFSSTSFQYSKMTFDNQYDGYGYNASYGTGENFSKNSSLHADVNLGAVIQYSLRQRSSLQYGISYNHLTSPKLTFIKDNTSKIDAKLTNYVSFTYPVAPQVDIQLEALYTKQGKYNELVPGASIKYYLDLSTSQAVSLGVYDRLKDAAIARIGYQYKTLNAGISYDLNTSKFNVATNRQGAIEFYVTYIFKKAIPFVAKKRVCPIYM